MASATLPSLAGEPCLWEVTQAAASAAVGSSTACGASSVRCFVSLPSPPWTRCRTLPHHLLVVPSPFLFPRAQGQVQRRQDLPQQLLGPRHMQQRPMLLQQWLLWCRLLHPWSLSLSLSLSLVFLHPASHSIDSLTRQKNHAQSAPLPVTMELALPPTRAPATTTGVVTRAPCRCAPPLVRTASAPAV